MLSKEILQRTKEGFVSAALFWAAFSALESNTVTAEENPLSNQGTSQEVAPSIFYGEEATVEQAASDAWLEMSDTWKHCSATVVGTNGIVTATHCMKRGDGELSKPENINLRFPNAPEQNGIPVRAIIPLEGVRDSLLLVTDPLMFSDTFRPARIASKPPITASSRFLLVGHGRNNRTYFTEWPNVSIQTPVDGLDPLNWCDFINQIVTKGEITGANEADGSVIRSSVGKGDSGGGAYLIEMVGGQEKLSFIGPIILMCSQTTSEGNPIASGTYTGIANLADRDLSLTAWQAYQEYLSAQQHHFFPFISNGSL